MMESKEGGFPVQKIGLGRDQLRNLTDFHNEAKYYEFFLTRSLKRCSGTIILEDISKNLNEIRSMNEISIFSFDLFTENKSLKIILQKDGQGKSMFQLTDLDNTKSEADY